MGHEEWIIRVELPHVAVEAFAGWTSLVAKVALMLLPAVRVLRPHVVVEEGWCGADLAAQGALRWW